MRREDSDRLIWSIVKTARLLASICIVFVLFFVVWNWSLVLNVSKPVLVQNFPILNQVPKPDSVPKNTFVYERLGIEAPLQNFSNTSPLQVSDWEKLRAALRKGVGLTYTTPNYNESNMVFVTGHSSDVTLSPYASIFAGLGQAKIGDQFTVSTSDEVYTYRVSQMRVYLPSDVDKFTHDNLAQKKNQKLAVLVTCWPVLSTRERMVIVGVQED